MRQRERPQETLAIHTRKNPNAKLMDFIERETVLEEAGLKGIAIEKVEAVQ